MRAITVVPGKPDSARLEEVPEPDRADGPVVVSTVALGVCGTDREIVAGEYGAAPPGQARLILGHESLGRVDEAPEESGLAPGDMVVGIVRRPDPVPCPACAVGEWDMCRNGRYTERGIKERHGYGAERFRIEPDFAIKIDAKLDLFGVLLEPTSIAAKAWDHIERIGRRAVWRPRTCLVTGAGPVGLLAALMGVQRGLEVHVLDRNSNGPKPALVRDLGAAFHADWSEVEALAPDILLECTGVSALIAAILGSTAPAGIVCLLGVSPPGQRLSLDVGEVNRRLVLANDVVFGSVNANRAHYEAAARSLARADRGWLARLITRRVPLAQWRQALERRPDDVKVVIDFAA